MFYNFILKIIESLNKLFPISLRKTNKRINGYIIEKRILYFQGFFRFFSLRHKTRIHLQKY